MLHSGLHYFIIRIYETRQGIVKMATIKKLEEEQQELIAKYAEIADCFYDEDLEYDREKASSELEALHKQILNADVQIERLKKGL